MHRVLPVSMGPAVLALAIFTTVGSHAPAEALTVTRPLFCAPDAWGHGTARDGGNEDSVHLQGDVSLHAKAWPPEAKNPPWQVQASGSTEVRVSRAGALLLTNYASSSGHAGTTPAQEPAPSGDLGSQGAVPVGQAEYAVPSDAIFVAPNGSDCNAGTSAKPLATVRTALQLASTGGTVVVRGGLYHERFTVTKRVTVQNYPGEAVWFDGSVLVTGFSADGDTWRKDGWTTTFDHSASFTRGSDTGGFVDPEYPMAAHPDQVWIDGVPQLQVGSPDDVAPGTFYVDETSQQLHVGSDPSGLAVRASTLGRAVAVRADGAVLRGFGVRRYAPSLPDMGAVTVERRGVTLENLHLIDNATVGISLVAADITASRLTVEGNGMLGVHGNHADRLWMEHILATGNNVERFNQSPSSGGIKITRSRDVVLDRATMSSNIGPGFWLDESVRHGTITNSVMHANAGHGISLELSDDMLVAGNVITDNGRFGLKINNTSSVRVWNNTIVRNGRPINIVQDVRRGANLSAAGQDPRYPGALSWINGPVEVHNNVLSALVGNCLLCVEDYSHEFSAPELGVATDHNVYQRTTPASPRWVAIWSRGQGNPAVYSNLPAFRAGTGQETTSLELLGTSAADREGRVSSAVRDAAGSTAAPLPADVADLMGVPHGTRVLGAGSQ